MKAYRLILACIAAIALGCTREAQPVRVVRLDQALAEYKDLSPAQRAAMADSLAPCIDAFFAFIGHPRPTPETLLWWSNAEVVETFQPDVDKAFPNLDGLEAQIGAMLMAARRDSLPLPPLHFAAAVWGRPQPIVRSDSVVLIALNHYLGKNYPGYSHWLPYRRAEKSPDFMPYDIAGVLGAANRPFDMGDSIPTLLNWMLYEGALVEARMRLVPDARLNLALGYDPAQLEIAEINCRPIWEEMIKRKMLSETDPGLIDRMLGAAPCPPLLDGNLPGRIGRYMGYMIVCEYLRRHPRTPLAFLLSPAFYASPETLPASGF